MRSTSRIPWLILILAVWCIDGTAISLAQTDDEIVVVVNDARITRLDVDVEASLLDTEMRYRNTVLSKKQLRRLHRQLIENLIERELLYQRAQGRKIEIRKRWVDRAIVDLKSELKAKNGYQAYLKSAGISEAQLRTRIQKGLIVRRLLRRDVIRQIKISEAEMQAFYRNNPEFFKRQEQIRIRQIMIAVKPADGNSKSAKALLKIQSIQAKLFNGGNFAALALDYSEDNTRSNGGDIGYLQRNQMIAPIADAAFSLEPGQVSDIVKSNLGYHLIQMVDRRPASQMAYRNVRTKIERTLRRNKEKKATDTYLAKLKRQASITRLTR